MPDSPEPEDQTQTITDDELEQYLRTFPPSVKQDDEMLRQFVTGVKSLGEGITLKYGPGPTPKQSFITLEGSKSLRGIFRDLVGGSLMKYEYWGQLYHLHMNTRIGNEDFAYSIGRFIEDDLAYFRYVRSLTNTAPVLT